LSGLFAVAGGHGSEVLELLKKLDEVSGAVRARAEVREVVRRQALDVGPCPALGERLAARIRGSIPGGLNQPRTDLGIPFL
jgi:hypothetical protein